MVDSQPHLHQDRRQGRNRAGRRHAPAQIMRCGSPPIGTVDETNAALGHGAAAHARRGWMPCWRASRTICSIWAPICACRKRAKRSEGRLRIAEAQVERLEREIDAMNAELAPLTSFVLPGGTRGRRRICIWRAPSSRRAERLMVELGATGTGGRAGAEIHQPAVGSSVRDEPLRQRQGREGRAVGSRRQPLIRCHNTKRNHRLARLG